MGASRRNLDPYAVLGVSRDAGADDIKAAFRNRAKETHPDRGGDKREFEAVTLSNVVLSDPARRKRYDDTGEIDDRAAVNPDERPLALINEVLAAMLAGDENPLQHDIVQSVVLTLRKHLEASAKQLAMLDRAKGRAEKMVKRFERKGKGENVLRGMIEWHIRQIGLTIEAEKAIGKDRQRAIEIASDHTFAPDPAMGVNRFRGLHAGYTPTGTFGR